MQCCIDERNRHGGGNVMIWGGITFDTKTPLHIVQGNLTANAYINQIVTPYVLPFLNANPGTTFQQDGARPHTARVTLDHLNRHNVNILPWLPKIPDLNPMEDVLNEIERRLKKRPTQPRTRAEPSQALQEEWQRFPRYRIRRLVSSMRRRCQACIAARGGHTRY